MDKIKRVKYYDKQFLTLSEFADEQNYHKSMRWNHNLRMHSMGIINGLEVAIDETDGTQKILVKEGAGIDKYGREIILYESKTLAIPLDVNQFEVCAAFVENFTKTNDSQEENRVEEIAYIFTYSQGSVLSTDLTADLKDEMKNNRILLMEFIKKDGNWIPDPSNVLRAGNKLQDNSSINVFNIEDKLIIKNKKKPWQTILSCDAEDTLNVEKNLHVNGKLEAQSLLIEDIKASGTVQAGNGLTVSSGNLTVSSGNVGIGTSTPAAKLDVAGNIKVSGAIIPSLGNSEGNGIMFPKNPGGGTEDSAYIRYYKNNGEEDCLFEIGTTNDPGDHIILNTGAGNVGISTKTPAAKLDVAGDIKCTLITTSAGKLDLAEITPVKEDDMLVQGDAVIIDPDDGLRVRKSNKAFDTLVYGIVSSYEQAGMVIGGSPHDNDNTKLPIALAGRVKAKISAEAGAIKPGDLLTTSSTPGHLMLCKEPYKGIGAIVGKALEAWEEGLGTITVLTTLQ